MAGSGAANPGDTKLPDSLTSPRKWRSATDDLSRSSKVWLSCSVACRLSTVVRSCPVVAPGNTARSSCPPGLARLECPNTPAGRGAPTGLVSATCCQGGGDQHTGLHRPAVASHPRYPTCVLPILGRDARQHRVAARRILVQEWLKVEKLPARNPNIPWNVFSGRLDWTLIKPPSWSKTASTPSGARTWTACARSPLARSIGSTATGPAPFSDENYADS